MIDERLVEVLADLQPPALSRAVDHAALAGGKRVRPTVTLLTCEFVGGDPADAVDFGVGIELVHTASLVVDDIIDRSSVRRGVESTWARFGYAPAIVASDGLLGEAFALFSGEPRAMGMVAESLVELGEGEAIELVDPPTNETEYRELARRKTGSLFRAAAGLGAVAAGANAVTVEAVGEYAERVGIAFQIRDDVLDATAEPDVLGKPTGHDAAMDRPSFVQVTDLSIDEANERAHAEADAAIDALGRIDEVEPDARAYLHDLAAFVVERER